MQILVTGATGNIGRMVVDHLVAAGGCEVRALTVDPARAALPAGVEAAVGSLRRPETLPAAFAGIDRVYLAPAPDTVAEAMALARDAGITRVVDLSGELDGWWGSVAAAVEASGIGWTHLWPGDFMENSEAWAAQIRATGAVREPYPDAASSPIAMDDIAAVAATALLTDRHENVAHTLTGPELLTRTELARHLADALGTPVEFRQVTRDEAVAALEPSIGENAAWYVDRSWPARPRARWRRPAPSRTSPAARRRPSPRGRGTTSTGSADARFHGSARRPRRPQGAGA